MKNIVRNCLGIVLLLLLGLGCAGCGDSGSAGEAAQANAPSYAEEGEAVQTDADDSALKIWVVTMEGMGEAWNDQFHAGAQKKMESLEPGITEEMLISAPESYAQIYEQGISAGCDGFLLAADPQDNDDAAEGIRKAAEQGIPTVSFRDHAGNGYNTAVPEEMGAAMAEALLSRIALMKGSSAWSGADFAGYLQQAVCGTWQTANSSGDVKQFMGYYVLEYSPAGAAGKYSLNRVSLVSAIDDTPDGKGYAYKLNTGNQYYLIPGEFGSMECHWEPDGYSASDSLVRTDIQASGSGDGNSTFLIDMGSAAGEESFRGRISRFEGNGAMGGPEECYALNLDSPVRIRTSDGMDQLAYAIQLNGDESLAGYADRGSTVTVTGTPFEAHTDHHFTPVLMDVSKVE